MSNIPAAAMPHAYAEEGVDLRDPHGGHGTEEQDQPDALPTGLLLGGAALLGFLLYRALR